MLVATGARRVWHKGQTATDDVPCVFLLARLNAAANISDAFTSAFLQTATGEYYDATVPIGGTQCMQSMPLYLDMVPSSVSSDVRDRIIAKLHASATVNQNHFIGGMFRWGTDTRSEGVVAHPCHREEGRGCVCAKREGFPIAARVCLRSLLPVEL